MVKDQEKTSQRGGKMLETKIHAEHNKKDDRGEIIDTIKGQQNVQKETANLWGKMFSDENITCSTGAKSYWCYFTLVLNTTGAKNTSDAGAKSHLVLNNTSVPSLPWCTGAGVPGFTNEFY